MITEKMKKIIFNIRNDLDNKLRKYNLTTVQVLILLYLNNNNDKEVIQKDICEHFSLKHSTVISILKKLIDKNLISKKEGYKSFISITNEGIKMLDLVGAKNGFIEDKLLDGFSDEEINNLSNMLDRMYSNILSENKI